MNKPHDPDHGLTSELIKKEHIIKRLSNDDVKKEFFDIEIVIDGKSIKYQQGKSIIDAYLNENKLQYTDVICSIIEYLNPEKTLWRQLSYKNKKLFNCDKFFYTLLCSHVPDIDRINFVKNRNMVSKMYLNNHTADKISDVAVFAEVDIANVDKSKIKDNLLERISKIKNQIKT